MKLSVGTNWDGRLVDEFSEIPEVEEVYGGFQFGTIGSGRSAYLTANIKEGDFQEYIKKLHANGIRFNYTLNAPCLNNHEYKKETHKALIQQLEWLVNAGVESVTVTIPLILEIIKKQFPQLRTKISVIAGVNSVSKAQFFEDMGADEILVDFMENRNFKLLEKIRRSVKCDLSLMLNDACNKGCAYRNYHYNVVGHASQSNNPSGNSFVEYCSIRCGIERLENPSLYLSSPWIRPEDIVHYENVGYDKFKISSRIMTTKWIVNATKAYASQKYDGNLTDLLILPMPGVDEKILPFNIEKNIKDSSGLKSDNIMKLSKLHVKRQFIDNNGLDGFIKHFIDDECSGECKQCEHCKTFANKVMKSDEEADKKSLCLYKEIIEDITTSRMFCYDGDKSELNKSKPNNEKEAEGSVLEILFPEKIKQVFEYSISKVPMHVRQVVSKSVKKAMIQNARERNDIEVNDEDLVKAFFKNSPEMVREEMVKGFRELGIDVQC